MCIRSPTASQVFPYGQGAQGAVRNVEIGKHLELDHLVGDVEESLRIHLEAGADCSHFHYETLR